MWGKAVATPAPTSYGSARFGFRLSHVTCGAAYRRLRGTKKRAGAPKRPGSWNWRPWLTDPPTGGPPDLGRVALAGPAPLGCYHLLRPVTQLIGLSDQRFARVEVVRQVRLQSEQDVLVGQSLDIVRVYPERGF